MATPVLPWETFCCPLPPTAPAQCSVETSLLGHASPWPPEVSTGEKAIFRGADPSMARLFLMPLGEPRDSPRGLTAMSPDRSRLL